MITDPKRFTDADLRRDAQLRAVAEAYARNYVGDWEPMVEAREVAMRGRLPIPIARMVCNTMRSDAAFWRAGDVAVVDQWDSAGRPMHVGRARREDLKVVPDRRVIVDTRAVVRSTHGLATGGKVHRVDRSTAYVRWTARRPDFSSAIYYEDRVPALKLRWICGVYPSRFRLLREDEWRSIGRDVGFCARCGA
jgi:hypothetical protein